MSSEYVRNQVKTFISTNLPAENLVDLTGEYDDLDKVLDRHGLGYEDPWLGLQFIAGEEIPINITSTNTIGCYREFGIVLVHFVAMAALGAGGGIITRGENFKGIVRGQRINDIVIESVGSINFESGSTLEFEGGYISGTISLSYYRDLNL
jgi:hypothetical protein